MIAPVVGPDPVNHVAGRPIFVVRYVVCIVAESANRRRVVSGMRPTGKLHLGHLVGALKNWVALQETYDCYYFVADWHALTSHYADTGEIVGSALDNVADWIAAGLDPERSTLFVQSLVPEHAELTLLLGMITPIPWLERVPTYKEQIDQLAERDLSSIGFLGYPLLQTADVIMYNAHFVPVGEDQVPHLELSREVVRRFHNFYGEVFVEPQPLLTPVPRLPGLDNRKMSKSYNNTIDLSDDGAAVQKKVRQMYTDPKRVRADIPGTVEGNPVFLYHDAFNQDVEQVEDLKSRYRLGKVGDVEVKTKLAAAVNAMLDPMRERRAAVLARPAYLRDVLFEGSRKARREAAETMDRVRDAMKLRYR
jgi:tryptophanyl-tRNA synthetase